MAIYDQSKRVTFLEQWTEVNMDEVVIKILQGSVVTQTVLGGLTKCTLYWDIWANYILQKASCKFRIVSQYVCAENYDEN